MRKEQISVSELTVGRLIYDDGTGTTTEVYANPRITDTVTSKVYTLTVESGVLKLVEV